MVGRAGLIMRDSSYTVAGSLLKSMFQSQVPPEETPIKAVVHPSGSELWLVGDDRVPRNAEKYSGVSTLCFTSTDEAYVLVGLGSVLMPATAMGGTLGMSTVRFKDVVCDGAPSELPVMVIGYVPTGVAALVCSVSVLLQFRLLSSGGVQEVGIKLAVVPAGSPLAARFTLCEMPFARYT